ncbi:hypothetical protein P9112_009643 [Eukaryota sp. TZLM1-RC]
MGLLSNPLDQHKQARISEICQDVIKVFVPTYLQTFKDTLVDYIVAQSEKSEAADFLLTPCPVDTSPIKTGYLTKRGDLRKNWKRRYFIIKHNCEVEYWEDESQVGQEGCRPKGTISPCGLRVIEDPEFEDRPFLFELRAGRGRDWFLEADSKEDKDDWVSAFRYACRRARPPLNEDHIMREAFIEAYRVTRYSFWIWDSHVIWVTKPEGEQLGLLISAKLEKEVMTDVYRELPKGGHGKIGALVKKQVRKTVDSIVGGAVNAAWKEVSGKVADLKPTIEDGLKKSIGPVCDAEVELRGKIKNAVLSTLDPLLSSTIVPLISKLSEALFPSITDAYAELVKSFDEIGEELLSNDQDNNYIHNIYTQIAYPWRSRIYPARRKLYANRERLELLTDLSRSFYPWRVLSDLADSLVWLMNNAVYTLQQEIELNGDIRQAIISVREKLVHDCLQMIKENALSILNEVISSPLNKDIIPAVSSLVEPLDASIPDVVKQFVSATKSLNNLLNDMIRELIRQGTAEYTAKAETIIV